MPAEFSRAKVQAVAALANLELDEPEITRYARQLGDILDHANQVQAIETAGVPPTARIAGRLPADRSDAVRPSLDRADALANAPDANPKAGLFRVPRVIG